MQGERTKEGHELHPKASGGADGDEITSWTVHVDLPTSPEKYEQVYVLKPEVRQTARYPPHVDDLGQTSTDPAISHMSDKLQQQPVRSASRAKRQRHARILEPIVEIVEVIKASMCNKKMHLSYNTWKV